MAIRVFLAEDHQMFRQAIRMALTAGNEIEVVGEAGNGLEAVAAVKALRPDICIMDIGLPRLNGLDATGRIGAEAPDTRVIILSQYTNSERVFQALRSGAEGFIVKEAAIEELKQAIRAVHSGFPYLSPAVLREVVEGYLAWAEEHGESPAWRLTPREREVLQLIAEGLSNQDIAQALELGGRTVETYRQNLMNKLGLHNPAQITRFAIRHGIIDADT